MILRANKENLLQPEGSTQMRSVLMQFALDAMDLR